MSAPRDIWKKVLNRVYNTLWEDMQRIQVPPDVQSTEVRLRRDNLEAFRTTLVSPLPFDFVHSTSWEQNSL